MVADGADLLDAGLEGTGPGTSEEEELDRLVPLVASLCQHFEVAVSVSTTKASVASAAFTAGAVVGNDPSGFGDHEYLSVAAAAGATMVAMLGSHASPLSPAPVEGDLVTEAERYLCERAKCALEKGVRADRIIVDPGPWGQNSADEARLLVRGSARLASLGYPLLLSMPDARRLGTSPPKSVDELRAASLAATALGIAAGYRLVRARDVAGTCMVRDLLASIMESAPEREARPGSAGPTDSAESQSAPLRSR
jgi:dihydropteroate synthase